MKRLSWCICFVLILASVVNSQQKYSSAEVSQDLDSLMCYIEEVEVNPYITVSRQAVYAMVDSIKRSMQEDSISDITAYRNIAVLLAKFKQGHLSCQKPNTVKSRLLKRSFPLSSVVEVVDGKRLIVNMDTVIQGNQFSKGDEIVSINSKKTSELIPNLLSHISGEFISYKESYLKANLWYYLGLIFSNDTVYTIDIKRKNEDIRYNMNATEYSNPKRNDVVPYKYSAINDSIWLFEFNKCKWNGFSEYIRGMFDSIAKKNVSHLIIDIRNNTGGNSATGDEICKYIANRPFSAYDRIDIKMSRILCEMYEQEYLSDSIFTLEIGDDDKIMPYESSRRFNGKVYLLGVIRFQT